MVDQAEETFWAVFKVLIDHTDRFLFSMLMEKKEDKKDGMLLPDTDLEKIKLNIFLFRSRQEQKWFIDE